MLNWSKLRGGGHEIALEDIHSSYLELFKKKRTWIKKKRKELLYNTKDNVPSGDIIYFIMLKGHHFDATMIQD